MAFSSWNSKGNIYQNVQAALFHTMKINLFTLDIWSAIWTTSSGAPKCSKWLENYIHDIHIPSPKQFNLIYFTGRVLFVLLPRNRVGRLLFYYLKHDFHQATHFICMDLIYSKNLCFINWYNVNIPAVHPESINSFPHFVMLQSYSKMDSIHYFPLNSTNNTP